MIDEVKVNVIWIILVPVLAVESKGK